MEKAARKARQEKRQKEADRAKALKESKKAVNARKFYLYERSKSFQDYLERVTTDDKLKRLDPKIKEKWLRVTDEIFKAAGEKADKYLPATFTTADTLLGCVAIIVAMREQRVDANRDTALAAAGSALFFFWGMFAEEEKEKIDSSRSFRTWLRRDLEMLPPQRETDWLQNVGRHHREGRGGALPTSTKTSKRSSATSRIGERLDGRSLRSCEVQSFRPEERGQKRTKRKSRSAVESRGENPPLRPTRIPRRGGPRLSPGPLRRYPDPPLSRNFTLRAACRRSSSTPRAAMRASDLRSDARAACYPGHAFARHFRAAHRLRAAFISGPGTLA